MDRDESTKLAQSRFGLKLPIGEGREEDSTIRLGLGKWRGPFKFESDSQAPSLTLHWPDTAHRNCWRLDC